MKKSIFYLIFSAVLFVLKTFVVIKNFSFFITVFLTVLEILLVIHLYNLIPKVERKISSISITWIITIAFLLMSIFTITFIHLLINNTIENTILIKIIFTILLTICGIIGCSYFSSIQTKILKNKKEKYYED